MATQGQFAKVNGNEGDRASYWERGLYWRWEPRYLVSGGNHEEVAARRLCHGRDGVYPDEYLLCI